MRGKDLNREKERSEFKVFGLFSASFSPLCFVILRVMSDLRDGGYFSDRPNRTSGEGSGDGDQVCVKSRRKEFGPKQNNLAFSFRAPGI